MIKKNEIIALDGDANGIAVKIVNSEGKGNFLYCNKDGNRKQVRLFPNLAVAKVITKSIVSDYIRLEYFFVVGNKTMSFDRAQKIGNSYQVYDNDTRYIITEDKTAKTIKLGYLVFENGDQIRIDKKLGNKKQKELLKRIRDVATSILCENDQDGIVNIYNKSNEYVIALKNYTAKIHILTNSKLMDINQARKEENKHCFPFKKEMDKFTTFYVYATKDMIEPIRLDTEKSVDTVLDYIVSDLNMYQSETDPEVRFVPVSYNGFITIDESN